MTGPFGDIDAKQCEEDVVGGSRLLVKTARILRERDSGSPLIAVAERVRHELEDFRPMLPLVTGLCNPGASGTALAQRVYLLPSCGQD